MPAAVDDVDDALDADVEHEVGGAVERRGAVDEGEVMHLVDVVHGGFDRGRVANVAMDELDLALDLAQPAKSSARISSNTALPRLGAATPSPGPSR